MFWGGDTPQSNSACGTQMASSGPAHTNKKQLYSHPQPWRAIMLLCRPAVPPISLIKERRLISQLDDSVNQSSSSLYKTERLDWTPFCLKALSSLFFSIL